jgi:hypothetical protein
VVEVVVVELQYSRDGLEDLHGRVPVATPLEPQVVVGADAREQRDLFASKTRYPTVRTRRESEGLRSDERATRPQVLAEPPRLLASVHASTVRASLAP